MYCELRTLRSRFFNGLYFNRLKSGRLFHRVFILTNVDSQKMVAYFTVFSQLKSVCLFVRRCFNQLKPESGQTFMIHDSNVKINSDPLKVVPSVETLTVST